MNDAEWMLLSAVYHRVLAQSLSPEAAKIAISTARKNGQLRMRATVHEHKAQPDLRLAPGEQPPQIPRTRRAAETPRPSRSSGIAKSRSTKRMLSRSAPRRRRPNQPRQQSSWLGRASKRRSRMISSLRYGPR